MISKPLIWKIIGATSLVGIPAATVAGITFGTAHKRKTKDLPPAISFGDKYFDKNIYGNNNFITSNLLSPQKGHNLFADYIDLNKVADSDHYKSMIEDAPGSDSLIETFKLSLANVNDIQELNKKLSEINEQLFNDAQKISNESIANGEDEKTLGIVANSMFFEGERVLTVSAYRMKSADKDQSILINDIFDKLKHQDSWENIINGMNNGDINWSNQFINFAATEELLDDAFASRVALNEPGGEVAFQMKTQTDKNNIISLDKTVDNLSSIEWEDASGAVQSQPVNFNFLNEKGEPELNDKIKTYR